MVCYKPLKGYRSKYLTSNGKRPITFNLSEAVHQGVVLVNCGRCIGCRLEKSRQWAVRCMHEAHLWEDNCFLTLTYDDLHLPRDGSLDVTHLQKFWKRLRKSAGRIRYYAAGEYGDRFGRPHYHAVVFNYRPDDCVLLKTTPQGNLYGSAKLEKIWSLGKVVIGEVTFQSAAYVARYVMKKVNGEQAKNHYMNFDPETGEVLPDLKPEFTVMSRRPGIGAGWLEKYRDDAYPSDFVIVNGKKIRPPSYYDRQLEKEVPDQYKRLRTQRKRGALRHAADNTPERRKVREKIQHAKAGLLQRNLKDH